MKSWLMPSDQRGMHNKVYCSFPLPCRLTHPWQTTDTVHTYNVITRPHIILPYLCKMTPVLRYDCPRKESLVPFCRARFQDNWTNLCDGYLKQRWMKTHTHKNAQTHTYTRTQVVWVWKTGPSVARGLSCASIAEHGNSDRAWRSPSSSGSMLSGTFTVNYQSIDCNNKCSLSLRTPMRHKNTSVTTSVYTGYNFSTSLCCSSSKVCTTC